MRTTATSPAFEVGALRAECERAARRADLCQEPVLLSISVPARRLDPIAVFSAARRAGDDATLWTIPADGISLVGVGALKTFIASGGDRFRAASRFWRDLLQNGVSDGAGFPPTSGVGPAPGPVVFGAFAFDDDGAAGPWAEFGNSRSLIPRIIYGIRENHAWITLSTMVDPGSDPAETAVVLQASLTDAVQSHDAVCSPETTPQDQAATSPNGQRPGTEPPVTQDLHPKDHWLNAVREVSARIREGDLTKAVLARGVRLTLTSEFDPGRALRYLRSNYPECYIYATAHGDSIFLGASPERIVRLQHHEIDVACLAGSTRRGATREEDLELADELMNDPKNREEHQVVLNSILAALDPVADEIDTAPEPRIRQLANVQHLYTPVRADLSEDHDILDLVDRIHPTPAIGGHPTDTALELIREVEGLDRGWYAGPIGWFDGAGQGEFAVGLRSALLSPSEAILYAGCGIMGDSDPESEYEESSLKLRPMLAALESAQS